MFSGIRKERRREFDCNTILHSALVKLPQIDKHNWGQQSELRQKIRKNEILKKKRVKSGSNRKSRGESGK